MSADELKREQAWKAYYGPNLGYIQEQYERYEQDPQSVEPAYQELFTRLGPPPLAIEASPFSQTQTEYNAADPKLLNKVVAAVKLVEAIRTYGHTAADIDPLGLGNKADQRRFEPQTYQLSREDLEALPASLLWSNAPAGVITGWDAITKLQKIYTRALAYEFTHVHDDEELQWLYNRVESDHFPAPLTSEEKVALLERLIEVEKFEHFLHRTFVGQKRFSIEGNDILVPMLDEIVRTQAHEGAQNIMMGMAHRGRLNVLAHVLGKPYGKIFSEFHHSPNKDMVPSEGSMGISYGWTGDVKYHLGADRAVKQGETVETRLTLANNPSHLEFVNPVVEGFTRAAQEDRDRRGFPKQDVSRAVAVLMHGDAAFPGEGIVAETLNFTKLKGYQNGGTIHIIVNNRIGFTTESSDSRSTRYASDLAKGYEIPIVHVNADDPEACITAVRLASEYRSRFKKDFLIDLIGYRRHGHNETDDPGTTQPLTYDKIKQHPTVYRLYAEKLKQKGLVSDEQIQAMVDQIEKELQKSYDEVKSDTDRQILLQSSIQDHDSALQSTAVPLNKLRSINEQLLKVPDSFQVYPKLSRILQRRANALDEGEKVDWALAETLAFATLLADGKPIRLSGQDSQRGTFAQRHLILHDYRTGEKYCPLHHLTEAKASFAIYNSPLSEASVLGYEYGYNVHSPETLVMWEAQYGDFTNVAQVIIDQFIAAGRAKWSQKSGLVMLLPHGYEGQGPEHSSARLERFLQSSGEENWTVANLTTAAQYFHILRRQAFMNDSDLARPLILMTPKSMIRNARTASPGKEFSEGAFQLILEQQGLGSHPGQVRRLIFCTGKIAIDLETELAKRTEEDWSWLHIVRVEQLYPLPQKEIAAVIERYAGLEQMLWVQEEPENMGAWRFMEPHLKALAPDGVDVSYAGRPERSSPAHGFVDIHNFEQQRIVSAALSHKSLTTTSPKGVAAHE
ncbi:2-oxoglutarate dehydrogenase E1 component [Paenibacillus senegalensis]|uniref:2-oxoglutarate dehydrogenase E1 component n=1 Tax=Paenibacillus senegalensis TaxID=1465766 RepID=UPI0002881854|nr:2-oxoglutarate dehydrogenase E1 component [Paenibacillus senegalensis]